MTHIDPHTGTYGPVEGLWVALCDGVLSVTLNRPESLNSLTEQMLSGIADVMKQAATDPRIKVVRLDGAGRSFSSGASIGAQDLADNPRALVSSVDALNCAVRAITALPQPVVAAVGGPAVGGGASLALACDVVLASETAYFLLAFTKVGLMPDGGASASVAATAGRIRTMRMAMLSERISAATALEWGLVTAVYPTESFEADVERLIASLIAGPAAAFVKTKEAINAATLTQLEPTFELEKQGQSLLLAARDFAEGAAAFRERRVPRFTD